MFGVLLIGLSASIYYNFKLAKKNDLLMSSFEGESRMLDYHCAAMIENNIKYQYDLSKGDVSIELREELSKGLTKMFLSGAKERLPAEFYATNRNFDHYSEHYLSQDALGWNADLAEGAFIVNEVEGIIALVKRIKDEKGRGGWLVVDSVVCIPKYLDYFDTNESYEQLGTAILEDINRRK